MNDLVSIPQSAFVKKQNKPNNFFYVKNLAKEGPYKSKTSTLCSRLTFVNLLILSVGTLSLISYNVEAFRLDFTIGSSPLPSTVPPVSS
jgi:hypothetical protein